MLDLLSVEKVGSEEVPEEPAKEDLIKPAAEGQYVATFQAQWQLFMDTRYACVLDNNY